MMQKEMDCAKILRHIESAVGAAKIGIDIIDSKYNIRYIDPTWKKIYGDPAGKKCFRYFMGRSSVCPHCGVREAFRTKKVTVKEEVLAREGNKPVRVTTVPFKDGVEWLVAETNVDIAGMKHVEQVLREGENRYRQLFEQSNDACFVADPRTRRIVDCNAQAQKLTEYSKRELLSMRADQFHPRCEAPMAMRAFKNMALGKTIGTETEILQKRKTRRAVSITGTPITIEGNNFLLGVFRDITERKNADYELRRTSSLLAATIESIFNGILVVNHDGEIVQHNQMFAEMWRIPKNVMDSRDDKKALACVLSQLKDPAGFLKKVKDLYKKPDRESYDVLNFKDGRVFERYSRPQRVGSEIVGRVWTFHDITLHKKAEEVLKRDAIELERLVQFRSAELLDAQDRLHKGKRLADVGRLAATIAHELRSPFAAIRTAGYNIKMKANDPRLESHLVNIDKKILEADQIIKNLLYYSSIKMPHRETFYFCRMMDECVELSKQVYRGQKVLIKRVCKCGKDLRIEGDPLQLKEVFNNLINNSYEAFADKKGRIEIVGKAGKGFLNVLIKDNGVGVGSKDTQKIFEPFFTTKAKGMGLGLPLCSQIISLHNGTINMTSRPGKGTVVEVRLPLKAKVEKSPKKVA